MKKKISVIMGVYNCGQTLAEALGCLVKQTYESWQAILCDDGSTDNSIEVIQKFIFQYPDKFLLLKNEKNMGLNYTLNRCLEFADGDYIARMDGDDLCSATRFEKEVQVLNSNPDIAIVSTDMEFFDEKGVWGRTHTKRIPEKRDFLKGTPFCHAACMVRREAYLSVGGYSIDSKLLRVEDYHLWVKMYQKGYRGINIQEPLYQMRDGRDALARKKFKYRVNEAYVKLYAVRHLNLPRISYVYVIKPILIGLLPSRVYTWLHHKKAATK